MTFELKEEHIEEILHTENSNEWYSAMKEMFSKYEINTPNRVAGFLAQTGHESAMYKTITENLNYSSKALDGAL